MNNKKRKDLKMMLGNLILAIFLATVPTAITYGTLSMHGLNICRNFSSKVENKNKTELKLKCDQSAWNTTKSYIILIGFFITLPTWLWIYLSMRKKLAKKISTN